MTTGYSATYNRNEDNCFEHKPEDMEAAARFRMLYAYHRQAGSPAMRQAGALLEAHGDHARVEHRLSGGRHGDATDYYLEVAGVPCAGQWRPTEECIHDEQRTT